MSSAETKRCAWLTLLAGERPSQPDDRVQLAALYVLSEETLLNCRGAMQAMTVHFSPDHATLKLGLSHPQQHGEAKRTADVKSFLYCRKLRMRYSDYKRS